MVGTVWLPTCSYLISILLFWWDSLCSHLYLFISYSGLTFVMAPLFVHLLAQFLFQSYLLINCSTGLYEDQLAEILFQSYLLTNNCYKLSIAVYAPTWHLTAVLDLTNSIHKKFSCQGPLFYTSARKWADLIFLFRWRVCMIHLNVNGNPFVTIVKFDLKCLTLYIPVQYRAGL